MSIPGAAGGVGRVPEHDWSIVLPENLEGRPALDPKLTAEIHRVVNSSLAAVRVAAAKPAPSPEPKKTGEISSSETIASTSPLPSERQKGHEYISLDDLLLVGESPEEPQNKDREWEQRMEQIAAIDAVAIDTMWNPKWGV